MQNSEETVLNDISEKLLRVNLNENVDSRLKKLALSRLIDDGEDWKLVYLSGTVCEDVNLILRHVEIITELREEVQFGKYDVTIVGKSQKRNMSHDLIQYINSSIWLKLFKIAPGSY